MRTTFLNLISFFFFVSDFFSSYFSGHFYFNKYGDVNYFKIKFFEQIWYAIFSWT